MLIRIKNRPMFWAWCAWILAALFTTAQFSLQTLSNLLHQFLQQDFSLSATGVGYLSAAFYFTFIPVQIPAGILYDRLGTRPVLTTGALVCGLGTLIFALSNNLWLAYLGRMLMGCGAGTSFVGLLYLTANHFPARSFGLLIGIGEAFGMSATALLERYGAISIADIGWRSTLLIYAASLLICAVLILLASSFLSREHLNQIKSSNSTQARNPWLDIFNGLCTIMYSRTAWIAAAIGFGLFSVVTAFSALWSTAFLTDIYKYSNQDAAFAVQFVFYGVAIGCPLITLWISLRNNIQHKLIISSGLIAAAALIFLTFSSYLSLVNTCLLMFVMGFCCSSYLISFYILKNTFPAKLQGAASGFGNSTICAGGLILQPLIGYLLDLNSHNPAANHSFIHYSAADYQLAFSIMALILVAAACGGILIRHPKYQVVESLEGGA